MIWHREAGTFSVLFNRDESTSRPIAEGPATYDGASRRFLAPRDPVGGGTWIAASEAGIVVALLNNYDAGFPTKPAISRGELVWKLAGGELASAEGLDDEACRLFAPFHLFVFHTETENIQQLSWDGRQTQRHLLSWEKGFFTTSSLDCAEVTKRRDQAFERYWASLNVKSIDALQRFLDDDSGDLPPAFSVMMNREDRRTVSQSRISLTSGEASFSYRECHLGGEATWQSTQLSLRPDAAESAQ